MGNVHLGDIAGKFVPQIDSLVPALYRIKILSNVSDVDYSFETKMLSTRFYAFDVLILTIFNPFP